MRTCTPWHEPPLVFVNGNTNSFEQYKLTFMPLRVQLFTVTDGPSDVSLRRTRAAVAA